MSAAHDEGGGTLALGAWDEPPHIQAIFRKPKADRGPQDRFQVQTWLLQTPRIVQIRALMAAGIGRYVSGVSAGVIDDALVAFFDKPLSGTIRNYSPEKGPYKHYLFRSLSNEASAQGKKLFRDEIQLVPFEDLENAKSKAEPSAESVVIGKQISAALQKCLDQLREIYRTVIRRFYDNGETEEEIANSLSCPIGSVKGWKHRAISELKHCMEAGWAA